MFKYADKNELNHISLTGMRAIIILGLLIKQPRTLDEIRNILINLNIIEESQSNDILRIDLNTIKLIGCEISRATAKNNYKYFIKKHPFCLNFEKEDINALKKVYNKIKKQANLTTLIKYDELFKKISSYIQDETIREALLGISILKYYDLNLIKELKMDWEQKSTIEILYKKPTSKNETKKEVIIQKIELKNDKIYIYCFNKNNNNQLILNLNRLIKIINRKFERKNIDFKTTNIKFLVKNLATITLENDEEIIEQIPEGTIIEGKYYNDFIATQRILSLGSNCIVLEPINFKNNIILKIKEMRKTYER